MSLLGKGGFLFSKGFSEHEKAYFCTDSSHYLVKTVKNVIPVRQGNLSWQLISFSFYVSMQRFSLGLHQIRVKQIV